MTDADLDKALEDEALAAGFAKFGVAEATALDDEGRQLDAWLAAGRHGEMGWMARTAAVRKDPRHAGMLPEAKSVVVLAAPYALGTATPTLEPGRIAKYAVGRDYHNVLTKRARRLQRRLRDAGHVARVAVDSKPVFERAWAERAGVGFVGKNCCLIVPGIGSHVFLVCIVTTARLTPTAPIARKCGTCSLCLDACPTRAFEGERSLDARKCISYLTIEHRGPIPEEQRRGLGPWVFGCDVCQDVCPYNRGAQAGVAPLPAFEPDSRWDQVDAAKLLTMDDQAFRAFSQGSPVKRATREGLARNAALVLGNRGGRSHLKVLGQAARHHDVPGVREAAAWALGELRSRLGESA
ncbi:MAG: tRNA epoxyqueuosine(34) reductase QueG [Myxococcota bacterium]